MERDTWRTAGRETHRSGGSRHGKPHDAAPRKKIGRKIIAFVVVVTAAQLWTLNHYNRILLKTFGGNATPIAVVQANTSAPYAALQKQYPIVALSQDMQSAAYIDRSNVLHVRDLVNNREVSKASNQFPVDYITWIRNDSVFVNEREPGGTLFLKRVDPLTGQAQPIHTFVGLLPSDDVTKIAFSAETNDTYVLIGNDTNTVIYHFDTNNNLTTADVGGRFIKNIGVSQTGDTLYFEDFAAGTFNVGELTLQGQLQILHRNSALVSVVGNTLYYGTLNAAGLVTAVYKDQNGSQVLVKSFPTAVKAANIRVSENGQVFA